MIHNTIIEAHYKAHRERLVKVVLRRVGWNHHLAEEAVQEAYTRALTYIHCYDPDKTLDGWFMTILNNSVKDTMKEERNRGMVLDDVDSAVHLVAIQEMFHSNTGSFALDHSMSEKSLINAIISVKNNLHKVVLELYIVKGLGYKDIVLITDAPSESMVRKVVSRFKESLKEK